MTELSRRALMQAAGATAAAVSLPISALAADATPATATAASGAAWDLSDLYPSDAAWAAERAAVTAALPSPDAVKHTLASPGSASIH